MKYAFKIKDWNKHFENAKSKTIQRKSWTMLPNKQHGLGYVTLIDLPNGPALYAAWVAMTLICSRQEAPRDGWLTDTGRIPGILSKDSKYPSEVLGMPLGIDELSAMTRISADIFGQALLALVSPKIGWMEVYDVTDTSRIAGIPAKDTEYLLKGYLVSTPGRIVNIPFTGRNLPEGKEVKEKQEKEKSSADAAVVVSSDSQNQEKPQEPSAVDRMVFEAFDAPDPQDTDQQRENAKRAKRMIHDLADGCGPGLTGITVSESLRNLTASTIGNYNPTTLTTWVYDHGEDEVRNALQIAARAGKRHGHYVNGILQKRAAAGYPKERSPVETDEEKISRLAREIPDTREEDADA